MAYSVEGECRNTGRTHFPKGVKPWNTGKVMSEEYRKRCSEDMMGRPSPRKGVKLSEETKNKIKETLLKRNAGKPHHDSHVYQNSFWKALRKVVYQRDNWKCQECGCGFNQKIKPNAHHIDYDTSNNDLSNLITLCNVCHGKVNYKKDEWINYYQDKMLLKEQQPTT